MGTPRRKDLTGQKFGALTVEGFDYSDANFAYWKCKCDCGKDKVVRGTHLRSGESTSCGLECYHKTNMQKYLGQKIGHFTIIDVNEEDTKKWKQYYVNVQCDCGNKASHALTRITTGKIQACDSQCCCGDRHQQYIGKVFGRLTIKEIVYKEVDSGGGRMFAKCLCQCGTEKDIVIKNITIDGVRSCGCLAREYAENRDGEKNSNWRGGITPENLAARASKEYWIWQRSVFERDKFTCQRCSYHHAHGNELNAHHIRNFSTNKELRFDTSNGITLCKPCHLSFHSTYGRDDNTTEQVSAFLNS